ncbi:DUF429 domain-containing protein [Pseudodesulfovibrio sp.]|uniref:DUF429 domain-containing protein n=1 Tax=unclassified Pseudodesulfovibrio TaxID=2661612 RepID=UPI003AFFCF7B
MWYVGVDACKGGWFAVGLGPDGARSALCREFSEVWELYGPITRVFVDMPVGLPERGVREADAEARKALPAHLSSTIFNTPVRRAVYAATKDEAKSINRELTGKSLSEQSLGIVKKIREVDTYLRAHPEVRDMVFESHPELCFGCLNGGFPSFAKKDLLGGLERFRIIRDFMPEVEFLLADSRRLHPRTIVAGDDMLDACILAVAARESGRPPRFHPAGLQRPETDAEGLPMAIWHPAARGES